MRCFLLILIFYFSSFVNCQWWRIFSRKVSPLAFPIVGPIPAIPNIDELRCDGRMVMDIVIGSNLFMPGAIFTGCVIDYRFFGPEMIFGTLHYAATGPTFMGLFDKGWPSHGIFTHPSRGRYEGTFKFSAWRGNSFYEFGRYTFRNGNVYEGSFKDNGKFHGVGRMRYHNGDTYEGDWVQGERQGLGRYFYNNGDHYEGSWKSNLKHGYGRMVYQTGNIYEGNWEYGARHGLGRLSQTNGELIFEGKFVNGYGNFVEPSTAFNDVCFCMEDFKEGEELRELSCRHAFHSDCLVRARKHSQKCPTCRHESLGGEKKIKYQKASIAADTDE